MIQFCSKTQNEERLFDSKTITPLEIKRDKLGFNQWLTLNEEMKNKFERDKK